MNEDFKKRIQVNQREEDASNRVYAAIVESQVARQEEAKVLEKQNTAKNEFRERISVAVENEKRVSKKLSPEELEEARKAGERAAAAMILSAEERLAAATRNKEEER